MQSAAYSPLSSFLQLFENVKTILNIGATEKQTGSLWTPGLVKQGIVQSLGLSSSRAFTTQTWGKREGTGT